MATRFHLKRSKANMRGRRWAQLLPILTIKKVEFTIVARRAALSCDAGFESLPLHPSERRAKMEFDRSRYRHRHKASQPEGIAKRG